jgi:2-amino-4-hydroxy-6-hydroxymethyldihydropteridine diphosphokinase
MIFLSLGSNLPSSFGNRFENINLAVSFIKENGINVLKQSSYYETNSYPDISKPKYINMIIKVSTNFKPSIFTSILLSIEEKLERKRLNKNDPRTCDIDIVDFEKKHMTFKCQNLSFTVPHKNLRYRNFVLFPLREVCPEWKHPITDESIDNLIGNLSNDDKNSILKIKNY